MWWKNKKTRIKGIFETTDKKKVTIIGAPSYTSGNHVWNGNKPSLKQKLARIKEKPKANSAYDLLNSVYVANTVMSLRLNVP